MTEAAFFTIGLYRLIGLKKYRPLAYTDTEADTFEYLSLFTWTDIFFTPCNLSRCVRDSDDPVHEEQIFKKLFVNLI